MLSYHIDPEARIVYIEGEQSRSPDEFPRFLRLIQADPDYRPGFGFLRDRRGMTPMPTPVLRANVVALRELVGSVGTRWAYVVSDPVNYGMVRMAGFLVEEFNGEVAIFDELEAAVQWLTERPAHHFA